MKFEHLLATIAIILWVNSVNSRHITFNISLTEYGYDEANNDDSYDSSEIDTHENSKRSICSNTQESFVANRENCNQFYVCDENNEENSEPSSGTCPPGMWFDPNHSDSEVLCVYPEVICVTNHTDVYRYCNCTQKYPALIVQVNDMNSKFDDPLLETSTQCVVDNQLYAYASEKDCERYFICYNEKVFRMQCKPGMHFNADEGYCDTPSEAQCDVSCLKSSSLSFVNNSVQ